MTYTEATRVPDYIKTCSQIRATVTGSDRLACKNVVTPG